MKRYVITIKHEAVVNADGRCSANCPSLLLSYSPRVFPSKCDLFKRDLVDRKPCMPCELLRREP
jgi:hypothetical protein